MKRSALFPPPHHDQIADFPAINPPSPSVSAFSRPRRRCHVPLFSNILFHPRQSRRLSQGNTGMLGKREQPGTALPAEVATGKAVPWEGYARDNSCSRHWEGWSLASFPASPARGVKRGWEGRRRRRGSGTANEGIRWLRAQLAGKKIRTSRSGLEWLGWALPHTLVRLLEPNTCGVVGSQVGKAPPGALPGHVWGLFGDCCLGIAATAGTRARSDGSVQMGSG